MVFNSDEARVEPQLHTFQVTNLGLSLNFFTSASWRILGIDPNAIDIRLNLLFTT